VEFRKLGNTELECTTIGFGAWVIGGWLWGGADDNESIAAIQRAFDLGINFFDTAAVYGFGRSERLIGKALKGHRDEVIIATKCGLEWDEEENVTRNSSREHVLRTCEESLKRLDTDYIDLHQVHWPDPNTPVEETIEALEELVRQGKIRYYGVSNFDVPLLERCMAVGRVSSLQNKYNLLEREIENAELPYCREHNIGVLAYSPMARGLLTGKFTEDWKFKEGDSRANNKMFQGETFKRNLRIVARLKELAAEHGRTVAQLALAWVLSQPGVTVALAGTRKPEQIEETAQASGWQLDEETLARIDDIVQNTE